METSNWKIQPIILGVCMSFLFSPIILKHHKNCKTTLNVSINIFKCIRVE